MYRPNSRAIFEHIHISEVSSSKILGRCNGLEYEYCLRIDNKIFTQCALVLSMAYINMNLLGRPKAELSKLIYSGTISEKEELLLLGEGK